MADALIRAVANARDLRFIVVDNTETVRAIAANHKVSGALLAPFGHIITAAQLLGTQLKGAGATSLLVQSDGVLKTLAADANPFGLVRATLPSSITEGPAALDTSKPLIGKGTLTVTRTLSDGGKPYRSIVELASPELALCMAFYLERSEQIRSCIGLATSFDHRGVTSSGGFMIQVFPESTKLGSIELVEATIAALPSVEALFAEASGPEAVAERLGEGCELEFMSRHTPEPFCPCSRESSERALIALGVTELNNLIEEGEPLKLNCDYCRTRYEFPISELERLRDAM